MDKRLNIILVEDDDDHAELTTYNLNKKDVAREIKRAKDGEEALELFYSFEKGNGENFPDIILMDLNIPKIDGIELLKALKKSRKLRIIPVIVLTTSNSVRDKQRAYDNYANSYIVKSMDYDEFSQTVEDLGVYWGRRNQFVSSREQA